MDKETLRAMGVNVIDLSDPLESENAQEMSLAEWEILGTKLYGENKLKWVFKCPCCGNRQTSEDFRQFKEQGATPDTVHYDCIGRWNPESVGTLFNNTQPCNYTLGGLFKLSSRVVITEEKKRIATFLFADEEK